ncbi:inositol monophosphatase family protein [Massilia sp. erpn]|uniref:inositol monophosphatase family protein n=1 Tax=Massilia sp. erpn TaxID=2738142 RepID=UPI002101D877|nr:inositol monophosphatase family protein [Massilia sp. erpn]UTY60320.1 inositol-phosphate phosphatase [Massilia sp. erpn]
MRQIDLDVILSLLRSVGEELGDAFRALQAAAEPEQMMEAFHRIDGGAAQAIRRELGAFYPHIAWRDERQADGQRVPDGECWLCDPIDGALQFLRGIPFWAMSLTLLRDGEPVFCTVFDAMNGEMFHAVEGRGAFRNGLRIGVNGGSSHRHGVLATNHPPFASAQPRVLALAASSLGAVQAEATAVRNLGSVALQLAYVACGRLDGFWQYGEDGFNCAGAALLVREAGGRTSTVDGLSYHPYSESLVAAPPGAHASLLLTLNGSSCLAAA